MAHAFIDRPGQVGIIVKRSDFRKRILPDEFTTVDDRGGDETDTANMGIKAEIELAIPLGNGVSALQTISTPGLWGVDYPSAYDEYGKGVFREECGTLEAMLAALGVQIVD